MTWFEVIDNQKVGGRRSREKVDYVQTGRGRRPKGTVGCVFLLTTTPTRWVYGIDHNARSTAVLERDR